MELTGGRPEIAIGLLDGPVVANHPNLIEAHLRAVPGGPAGVCLEPNGIACGHGTFVAGILGASRDSVAPAICPDCTLLVRPIFGDAPTEPEWTPQATPEELAEAIVACIDAGARVLNLSAALAEPSTRSEPRLHAALDYAMQRDVLVVAAAGNQGAVGTSAITRHPWVIPVVACDLHGLPTGQSNLGRSIGRAGLGAPGEGITSLGINGSAVTLSGTSVATPFVTGTAALLWSIFPAISAAEIKLAVSRASGPRRTTIVPPLLDAWASYHHLAMDYGRRRIW